MQRNGVLERRPSFLRTFCIYLYMNDYYIELLMVSKFPMRHSAIRSAHQVRPDVWPGGTGA